MTEDKIENKSKLLVHSCCSPCSTHVVNLLKDTFNLTLYFYNPNIHPEEEYIRRWMEIKVFSRRFGLNLIGNEYDPQRWFEAVKGLESEKEGGRRCEVCFRLRIERVGEYAKKNGFQYFTTVMSISPHKDAKLINTIGEEVAKKLDIIFYSADFKKKDGYKISCILSRKYGLYRQDYCGCIFSRKR